MTIINRVLEGAEFGEEVSHQGLTMFPFRSGSGGNASYLTLTKALNTGSVHVSEVSEGGSVPELLFKNSADVPVLIVDGEELVGAKQNRVANLTILAPAGISHTSAARRIGARSTPSKTISDQATASSRSSVAPGTTAAGASARP